MEQADKLAFVGLLSKSGRTISKTSGKKQNSVGFVLYFSELDYYFHFVNLLHIHVNGSTADFHAEA